VSGHPLEIGHAFRQERLDALRIEEGKQRDAAFQSAPVASADWKSASHSLPLLAALLCHSIFDLAIFDAFGSLHNRPVFDCFGEDLLGSDLAHFLEPREVFAGKWPGQFLLPRREQLPVWHLVGGLDPIEADELKGDEPSDGYPVLLRDWIHADGLRCLKIKLRGNNAKWDYERLLRIGQIAIEENSEWLTADFNCTVTDPAYVTDILDRLLVEQPRIYGMLLYIEQPFPYELESHRIDVRSVSARKPLFLDESAHDWRQVCLGRDLGWTGVALKTCKTLTGAILSLCWARSHGMTLMVQDLTNPMLAQIPHVLLAAHAGTIMGIESNAMQFYPDASLPEAAVHPGVYRRRGGLLDLRTLTGAGFAYHLEKINRKLPSPEAKF
jgi:L-alanine-DL-glutamate epimerase-like enolase superfamily enzyme